MTGYLFLLLMILLTVYGQLIFKWQVDRMGGLPAGFGESLSALARFLINPWVISGFLAAFLASLAWMGVLTQFELSFAYPLTSFSFMLVLVFSAIFFGESLTLTKVAGVALIALGILVGSR